MKAEWIGLREGTRALRKLPAYVQEHAQREIDVTAFRVQQLAQQRAPVSADGSHGHAPGFLKNSIRWRSRPQFLSAVVGVDVDAFYWKYLEYGTVHLSARPMFRPAAEIVRDDHHARFLHALTEAADRVERTAASGLV